MGRCQLATQTSYGMDKFTCDEVRRFKHEWLNEFCEKNNVRNFEKDRMFQSYKKQINDFLDQCTCEPNSYYDQQKVIPEKNQEAESEVSKNIREAKERRKAGETWIRK